MSESPSPAQEAWTHSLPSVLAVMGPAERGMFRQELQRYLAMVRFQPEQAVQFGPALKEVLLQALRAVRLPGPLNITRGVEPGEDLSALCNHLLAQWREAEERAGGGGPVGSAARCGGEAMGNEVFFGPRLGGPGRAGARTPEVAPSEGGGNEVS